MNARHFLTLRVNNLPETPKRQYVNRSFAYSGAMTSSQGVFNKADAGRAKETRQNQGTRANVCFQCGFGFDIGRAARGNTDTTIESVTLEPPFRSNRNGIGSRQLSRKTRGLASSSFRQTECRYTRCNINDGALSRLNALGEPILRLVFETAADRCDASETRLPYSKAAVGPDRDAGIVAGAESCVGPSASSSVSE
jgi:hypothetical protein